MSSIENIFAAQRVSNTSNYSGVYQTGVDYKKFDFVQNDDDGLFYYAREDVADGGGIYIQDNYRLALVNASDSNDYIVDLYNQLDQVGATFKEGLVINLSGSLQGSDGLYQVEQVSKDQTSLNGDTNFTGSIMRVRALGGDGIKETEEEGPNILTISALSLSPSESPLAWAKDEFFFDADYGSTVSFRANNYRYDYGNGYYILQPKNLNSITFEADLKFKNRTNREANAIVHFLENHQGQHERDRASPNLKYKQGISGFRWDGNSSFHPYDSTEVQSKKFYCSEWSHSLNFENSNDVNVKLRNLDASLLQKTSGLFVKPAPSYDETEFYEKNDVVYNAENRQHYYWSGDSSSVGRSPAQKQTSWTRQNGYFKDTNTEYWTRKFFWKPSIGLNVSQKPRMNEISLGAGYTQIYADGINESLLNLDLQFNNRNDDEAYAILHFLEQHYGCRPFMFTPPSPYDKEQNFVCQEWSHTYNYKNNHSISAKFEQYPFNFEAEEYDNMTPPPIESDAELVFTSPAVMRSKNQGTPVNISDVFRSRIYLKNIGDKPLTISSAIINLSLDGVVDRGISNVEFSTNLTTLGNGYLNGGSIQINGQTRIIESYTRVSGLIKLTEPLSSTPSLGSTFTITNFDDGSYFSILAKSGSNIPMINTSESNDRRFILPDDSGLGIFSTREIRIGKKFKSGPEGGYTFVYLGADLQEISGGETFIQFNNGTIRSLTNRDFVVNATSFVNEQFISNNLTNILNGGEEGYIEVVFSGVDESEIVELLNVNGNELVTSDTGDSIELLRSSRYYNATISISSDSLYGTQTGEIKIFID